MVIRQNGQPRSPFESVFNDPSSYRFGQPAKLGISATLDGPELLVSAFAFAPVTDYSTLDT